MIDRLLIANSNRIFVYSSQSRTIYELSLGGGFTESGLRTNIPTTNTHKPQRSQIRIRG